MSRHIRLILTAIFVVGFFVAAPLVLLYTAGYKYDWSKHRVLKTGIIQTDSVPTKANVILNGIATGKVTPAPITRLLPEEYTVRFEKDGYFPWEKTVEVRSSETSFVTGAALIPDVPPSLVRADAASLAAFTDDGKRVAYLRDGDGWKELTVLDLASGSAKRAAPVTLARFSDDAMRAVRLSWSPDGQRLLLAADGAKDATTLLLYDTAGGKEPVALHESFPATRLSAAWSTDGASVVIVAPTGVFLAAAGGAIAPAAISSGIVDAALAGRNLYVLRRTADGVTLERRGTTPDSAAHALADFPEGQYRFLDASGPYLLVADGGRGKLSVLSPDDGTVAETIAATDARWLPKSREPRLLAWNDFEISAVMPQSGGRQLVTRIGSRIDGCAWHPSGLAVFYAAGDKIHAVDLDAGEPKNDVTLGEVQAFAGFATDAADGMLRFVGTVGGQAGTYERPY